MRMICTTSKTAVIILKKDIISLNDELGMNPALKALEPLFKEGLISVLNGVGYPNPERSHFRSMDIWHTASNTDEYWKTGWLRDTMPVTIIVNLCTKLSR